MKKFAPLIISIVAFVVAVTLGVLALTLKPKAAAPAEGSAAVPTENAGTIAFVQLDQILDQYDMANDLRSVVETKVGNIQAEINRRGKKLESDVNAFQEKINKGLMTRSVAEAQQAKLEQQQQEFNEYANKKQNEINEEQMVMMNQISDAIKTYVEKYNVDKGYAMILCNQGGVPILTGSASLDITQEVLDGLNAEYIKTKNTKE